jgi:hypothetical protein
MTDTDIHSCGYYCDRHACIVAQRNELRDKFIATIPTPIPLKPEPTIDGWPLWSGLPQPEPEPVAWGVDEGEGKCISLHDLYFVKGDADHMAELKGTHAKVVALYTTPPKKEWVGLTDEEARELCVANVPYVVDMVRALEAKLKEKNNG